MSGSKQIAPIAQPAGGGISTVQDLYNLINGNTTTVGGSTQTNSGGTSTTTETNGISQAGMDAMLQNILSGTQGLAQVSSGQRSAGGYGSSVNTMLTNDLLTRSAGQVAALNTTRTTTAVTSPTTIVKTPTETTVGGITGKGTAKVGTTIAMLQALSKLTGSKDGNLLKQVKDMLGMGAANNSSGASLNLGAGENASNINAVNGADFQSDNFVAQAGVNAPVASSSSIDSNSFIAPDAGGDAGADFNFNFGETGGDIATGEFNMTDGQDYGAYNPPPVAPVFEEFTFGELEFADGGLVDTSALKRKSSVLGTSQFNSHKAPSENSLAGSVNAMNFAVPSAASSSPIGANTAAPSNTNSPVEGNGGEGDTGPNQGNEDGSFGTLSGTQIGTAIGVMGAVTGNPGLNAVGQAIGIGSSPNPGRSALNAAASATGFGAVASAIGNPTAANIADIAMSVANPAIGAINATLGMLGIATLGQIGENIADMVSPNNPVGPAQQASINAANAAAANNSAETEALNAVANLSADPMQGLMDATQGFGTMNTSGMNSGGTDANANSAGAASDGSADTGAGSTAGGGDSSSASDTSGGEGFSNGGEVDGPGTGISDSITAKLSDGEFVLSADVVRAVGIDKLQALQNKYHVPAAVQKLKQFGRGR